MKTIKIWKDLVGYEGLYKISSFGEIFSCKKNRIIIKSKTQGYYHFGARKNGKNRTLRVHVMVMKTFIGERPNGKCINHIDGIKTNNCLSNLEYCTLSENTKHAHSLGLANINKYGLNIACKLNLKEISEIKKMIKMGISQKEIAKKFNVHKSNVSKINRGHTWN